MPTTKSLDGKNAIVTGGSRGIGKGIALELAYRGANILITYNSSRCSADATVTEIRKAGVDAIAIKASATDPDAPHTVVKAAVDRWKEIDIIVNNAGAREDYTFEEMTYGNWERQLATNLRFPVFLVKEATSFFGAAPRIVNLSSSYAVDGHAGSLAYVAAKGGIESVTRALARELGHKYNATVNCVRPGPVNTDLWERSKDLGGLDEWGAIIKGTPAAPRVAEVDDIAKIVGFLAEEQSRWVSGDVINASGGLLFG